MPQPPSPRTLYSEVRSAEGLKKIFDGMEAAEKCSLLLTPLNAMVTENTLSYMVSGYFRSGSDPREKLVKAVLDEIEKATEDKNRRLSILTSADYLGQTVFHKSFKDSGGLPVFDLLTEKLTQWSDGSFAADWMKTFLDQRFGAIDKDISYSLQGLRDIRPSVSEESRRIQDLCCDYYKPAEYNALKDAVDNIRPLVMEWLAKNPADQKDAYTIKENEALKAFAGDPEAVKQCATPFTQAFPEKMFEKILTLRQISDPKTPTQQAADIFNQLSQQDANGKTAMHRSWQHSRLMGPPPGSGSVSDSLSAVIAGFDRLLGETAALDLTKNLLLLENANGELPLDRFEYNDLPRRNYYIDAFLYNLGKELGSQKKFELYVKEAIAPVLPPDFTISLAKYAPAEINAKTGQPKPKRGAQIKP